MTGKNLLQPDFEKVVDLDKTIKSEKYRILKLLPKFAINRMKRIIHQDDLNLLHNKYRHLWGIDYVHALMEDLNVKIDIENSEYLRKDSRYIYVANHPLGGIDAMAFLIAIYSVHGIVISPSNDLFNYVPNLSPLILGVNVFGKGNKENIDKLNKLFESDVPVMIFPAGEVSRKRNGIICDSEWHKTFVSKAVQYKRQVVPAFISGQNSNFFYNLANFRKMLGLKMYVETLYLPDEMLKQRNTNLTITYGKPIDYTFFDKSRTPQEWTQFVKETVYKLSNK